MLNELIVWFSELDCAVNLPYKLSKPMNLILYIMCIYVRTGLGFRQPNSLYSNQKRQREKVTGENSGRLFQSVTVYH